MNFAFAVSQTSTNPSRYSGISNQNLYYPDWVVFTLSIDTEIYRFEFLNKERIV